MQAILLEGSCIPPKAYTFPLPVSKLSRVAKRGPCILRQAQMHQDASKRLQTALPAMRGRTRDDAGHSKMKEWGSKTITLASGATAVFLVLLMPQIIRNAKNIMRGDYSALSAIAWVGYLTALLGNVMLLNYFLGRSERSGATIQAVGIATNVIVLTQVRITGGLPLSIYYSTAVLVTVSVVMSIYKSQGHGGESKEPVLSAYSDFLGIVGVSSLSQASASTFFGWTNLTPGISGASFASLLLILDRVGKLKGFWKRLWRGIPAWSATLLFAFQPVAQLVSNFSHPASLAGLSKVTLLLAMIGNGLMIPRALFTRDIVWLAGSAWASFTGWFQLFSLFVNRSPDGLRYLGRPEMLGATLLYLSYNALILKKDLEVKELPLRPASLRSCMSS